MTARFAGGNAEAGPAVAYEAARLRWAQPADAEALAALWREARPEGGSDRATMRAWLEHGGAMLLEDGDGRLLCALRWREEPGGWRVDRIATVPDARGQGYGRWLMTMVEAAAIRHNIAQLTLELDRADLLPYYRRLGYRRDGVDDGADPGADPGAGRGAGEPGGPDGAGTGGSDGTLKLSKRVGGTWQVQEPRGAAGSGGTA